MLNVVLKSRFKKDLKKLRSSHRNQEELLGVIEVLASEQLLASQNVTSAPTGY